MCMCIIADCVCVFMLTVVCVCVYVYNIVCIASHCIGIAPNVYMRLICLNFVPSSAFPLIFSLPPPPPQCYCHCYYIKAYSQ